MSYIPSHIPGSGPPPSHKYDWVMQALAVALGIGVLIWYFLAVSRLK